MKVLLCVFAFLFPFVAFADDPFYLGLSAGVAIADEESIGLIDIPVDDTAPSVQAYLGWQPYRFAAMELSYTYLTKLESDRIFVGGDEVRTNFKGGSLGLGLVLTPGIGTITTKLNRKGMRIRPFITAGWHKSSLEEEIEIEDSGNGEEDHDGNGPYYGLGVDIEATEGLFFRLEWRRMRYEAPDDVDVDMLWLGLRENFRWK